MSQNNQTNIRVELQYTMNLGNYESLKIMIGVEDYRRDGESMDDATDRIYKFVEEKLSDKISEEKSAKEQKNVKH
jgi:hypothetical protein